MTIARLLLVSFILLPACSSYSKRQCQEMDWYAEGKKAAQQGLTRKQGRTHFVDKCQENQGVAVDTVEFERGYRTGLIKFCTPEALTALEQKGAAYPRICDALEEANQTERSRGSELEAKVRHLEIENARLQAENEQLKSQKSCPASD